MFLYYVFSWLVEKYKNVTSMLMRFWSKISRMFLCVFLLIILRLKICVFYTTIRLFITSVNLKTILKDLWINAKIIIIMSRHQHGYTWASLATPPYRPLLSAGLQGNIPYRHRAAVCRFELVVLPLLVHVKGSTGVHLLWARPYFSSSVLHVWFI